MRGRDDEGEEIFADKVGVMIARDISALHKTRCSSPDVKSTGLFMTDPTLAKNGARTDYWKTGHSYMKRRTNELGALAGSRSRGTSSSTSRSARLRRRTRVGDCDRDMLDRAPDKKMSDLKKAYPKPGHRPRWRRTVPMRENTS